MKLRCVDCMFWEDTNDSGGQEGYRHGKCRRFPPHSTSSWPFTLPNDWCGEHASETPLKQEAAPLGDAYELVEEYALTAQH